MAAGRVRGAQRFLAKGREGRTVARFMWREVLAPFRAPNFLKFWLGQAVSLTGSWLTATAVNWHVFALTHSVVTQGWFTFVQQAPTTLLAPFAGVWADRVDRRRFLLLAQSAGMAASAGLTLFAWFDGRTLAILAVLCGLRGVVSAIEVPARQVMVIRFVRDASLLGRAIALNSTLFNLTRFVGPALAGWLYLSGEGLPGPVAGGAAVCFLLDTLSFVPVILLVRGMRLEPEPAAAGPRVGALAALRDGVAYARGHAEARVLLPAMAMLSLFGLSYAVLLPRLAAKEYAGNSRTYGWFLASVAVGSLVAALSLAMARDGRRMRGRIAIGAALLGVALGVLAFTPPAPAVYLVLACAGAGGVTAMAATNTVIQSTVDEAYRGRVLGLFHLCFSGMFPFGAPVCGHLTERLGLRGALLISAGAALLVGARVISARRR